MCKCGFNKVTPTKASRQNPIVSPNHHMCMWDTWLPIETMSLSTVIPQRPTVFTQAGPSALGLPRPLGVGPLWPPWDFIISTRHYYYY